MKITVLKADITTLEVDAIINAANSHGWLVQRPFNFSLSEMHKCL